MKGVLAVIAVMLLIKINKLDENSIEYWNELRIKQGLRPLKDTKSDQKDAK